MLCNLVEKGRSKCHDYWPLNKKEPKEFENFKVELIDEKNVSDLEYLIQRKFLLTGNKKTDSPVEVTQLHYTGWPDHGVPKVKDAYMYYDAMFNIINTFNEIKPSPTVVHCSAGIGRTGTFMASYNLWKSIEERYSELKKEIENNSPSSTSKKDLENLNINLNLGKECNVNVVQPPKNFSFSIFRTVIKIKDSRCYSIENPKQYELIYHYLIMLFEKMKLRK